MEESWESRKILSSFNSTYIALIPNTDNPQSFDDFQPISLCNCIYKVVAKFIARRVKKLLSKSISGEQFGFLEGRQIHEAIGVAQEVLHGIKTKNLKGFVLKIDMFKAYDRVSCLCRGVLLTQLAFALPFINLIMSCITTVSFEFLINGPASPFFHNKQGLRQGCPLSALI